MHWFHYVGKVIAKFLLLALLSYRVAGRENVPGKGPVLVVANHLNNADPPILSVSLGRSAVFMAKEELFRSAFSRFFVSGFGAFPVRRGGMDRRALQEAEEWLGKGKAVVMFPEGRRSRTGRLQAGFPGSALIACRNGVPVLPAGITGSERIKGWGWLLRRPKITVTFGPAFKLSAGSTPDHVELARQTEMIMENISRLLPPEYRAAAEEKI